MNRRQLREYTVKLLFHANFYDKEELNEQGIYSNTIRLSIGTENIDDIIEDLEGGFQSV